MRTSENRTTEIRRSQWPAAYILLKILFSLDFNLVLGLQIKNNFHGYTFVVNSWLGPTGLPRK